MHFTPPGTLPFGSRLPGYERKTFGYSFQIRDDPIKKQTNVITKTLIPASRDKPLISLQHTSNKKDTFLPKLHHSNQEHIFSLPKTPFLSKLEKSTLENNDKIEKVLPKDSINFGYLPPKEEKIENGPPAPPEADYLPPNPYELPKLGTTQSSLLTGYLPPKEEPISFPSSDYLPPNKDIKNIQLDYLPPKLDYLPPTEEPLDIPQTDYLPPKKKEEITNLDLSYLPPKEEKLDPPDSDYLPPKQEFQFPETDYLPPKQEFQLPETDYLPPKQEFQLPETDYLPPQKEVSLPLTLDYLPPEEKTDLLEVDYLPPNKETPELPISSYLPPSEEISSQDLLKLKEDSLESVSLPQNFIVQPKTPLFGFHDSSSPDLGYLVPEHQKQSFVLNEFSFTPLDVKFDDTTKKPFPFSLIRDRQENPVKAYSNYVNKQSKEESLKPYSIVSEVSHTKAKPLKIEPVHQPYGLVSENTHTPIKPVLGDAMIHAYGLIGEKKKLPIRPIKENTSKEPYGLIAENKDESVKPLLGDAMNNPYALVGDIKHHTVKPIAESNPSKPFSLIREEEHSIIVPDKSTNLKTPLSVIYSHTDKRIIPTRDQIVLNPISLKNSYNSNVIVGGSKKDSIHRKVVSSSRSECKVNQECSVKDICIDGSCIEACTITKGLCVGHSMCKTRNHVPGCICPDTFTAVMMMERGAMKFDCMPMQMMSSPRPTNVPFRVLSSSFMSPLGVLCKKINSA